jgi:glucose/arabinose dehydrogenase
VLDLNVRTDSELGLLGLAFHPAYPKNGLFYVNSNPADGEMRTRVAEWRLPREDLGKQRASDERVVLEVGQPYQNHDGGGLAFGPDGFLYIGLGDGGWRNDPHGHGQKLDTLLGKMLRIDVSSRAAGAYGIPPDNPFVGTSGARPEIWAYGLRNPWRYSFDPHGRLVAGDVGQDQWEEIDLVGRGENLGWNVREATHCFAPKEGCRTSGLVDPIFEYGREAGTSVTGGFVYTGADVPELADHYVFGDFTSGRVWAMKLPSPHLTSKGLRPARELGKWPFLISSFARDERGELYLLDYAGGTVQRLAAGRAP